MRNWTIKEATEVINAGTDLEAIKEIAKHFPIFFMHAVKNDLTGVVQGMGEKFTVRRLEFDGAVEENDDADTEDAEDAEDAGDVAIEGNLGAMSTKELMKLCDKKGIKVPHYGKNKQFYLDALTGDGESEDEDEAVEENKYEGKTAMELYKMAKDAGLKPEPKQKAAHYIAMLEKAGADDAEEAEEDWGEEEAVEETKPKSKPVAKAAPVAKNTKAEKPAAAPAKSTKPAAKAKAAADDEDWDI